MISIHEVSKKYRRTVIQDLSMDIGSNTFMHISGANGSGKTTLLKMTAGMEEASSGTILINGICHKKKPYEYVSNIGFLSDEPFLYPYLTGSEQTQLDINIRNSAHSKDAFELLDYLGLSKTDLNEPIHNYSKGMKQKLAFVLAIYHKPNVLIMDEPFTGMDKESLKLAINYCKEAMQNKVILFSSHQPEIADGLCNSRMQLKKL